MRQETGSGVRRDHRAADAPDPRLDRATSPSAAIPPRNAPNTPSNTPNPPNNPPNPPNNPPNPPNNPR